MATAVFTRVEEAGPRRELEVAAQAHPRRAHVTHDPHQAGLLVDRNKSRPPRPSPGSRPRQAEAQKDAIDWTGLPVALCKKRSKKTLCFETQILERVSKTYFQTFWFETCLQ